MNQLCLQGHRPRLEWDGSSRVKTREDLADLLEQTALEMLRISRDLRQGKDVRDGDMYYLQNEIHVAATTLESFDFDAVSAA